VRHVGEEVGLVLAGLLQFARPQLERRAGALKIVALHFQRLGLLFQLAVGLFQFDLLLLKPNLRFPERGGLFFELFVGNAQFLALRLQFLGLALGFLQCNLQLRAEACGTQRNTDSCRGLLEQFESGVVDRVEEPQFDHRVHGAVGLCWNDDQMTGPVPSESGTDRQVAFGYIVEDHRASIGRNLPEQALAFAEGRRHSGIGGNAQCGHAVEAAAFALEQDTALATQTLREEAENCVAQLLDRLVPHHRGGQANLAGLQPLLPRPAAAVPHQQHENGNRQDQPKRAGDDRSGDGRSGRGRHLIQMDLAETQFFLLHTAQLQAYGIHRCLAAVGRNHGKRGIEPLCAPQFDRFAQFRQFRVDLALQRSDVILLKGIVSGQLRDVLEMTGGLGDSCGIGLEIAVVTGQKVTPLSRFGVLG